MRSGNFLIMLSVTVGVWLGGVSVLHAAGDPLKGRPVYEKYCLLCHGPQGAGDGPQGKLMNPPAANFRSAESKSKSDAVLLKSIREGHPKAAMAGWKDKLKEEDLMDVLAYIRHLSGAPEKGL